MTLEFTEAAQQELNLFGMPKELAEQLYMLTPEHEAMPAIVRHNHIIDDHDVRLAVTSFYAFLHENLHQMGFDVPPKEFSETDIRHSVGTPDRVALIHAIIDEAENNKRLGMPRYEGDDPHPIIYNLLKEMAEDVFELPTARASFFENLPTPANDTSAPTISGTMPPHILMKLNDLMSIPNPSDPYMLMFPDIHDVETNFKICLIYSLQSFGYEVPETASKIDWQSLYHDPAAMVAAYQVIRSYSASTRHDMYNEQFEDNPEAPANPHTPIPVATLEQPMSVIATRLKLTQIREPDFLVNAREAVYMEAIAPNRKPEPEPERER